MKYLFFLLLIFVSFSIFGQQSNIIWDDTGDGYYSINQGNIIHNDLKTKSETLFLSLEESNAPFEGIKSFYFSDDKSKLLVFTNAQRVWRYETRGDYWIWDINSHEYYQLGKDLPGASLMFAKISPDGSKAAYVSNNNIYVEDLRGHDVKKLTSSEGTAKLINGTFDWAYEEEFSCLDGFRWGPDSKTIAYWQIDANKIKDFYMINNTDSIYSELIPIEYPKVGESPSACRIGIVDISSGETKWAQVPGDDQQNYIPRLEWNYELNRIVLQQLNRKQNTSKLFSLNPANGQTKLIYEESDSAWISVRSSWKNGNSWYWLKGNKSFLWITEKDGWRHIYEISQNGKKERLITKGEYDVIDALEIDEKNNTLYFTASPENATEKYLYSVDLEGNKDAKRLSPGNLAGTHSYQISPNGKYAMHRFSNYFTSPKREWIELPSHKSIDENPIENRFIPEDEARSNIKFFRVTTEDGVEMDGFMALPNNFDSTLSYPVVFNVYSEPAGQTVVNRYGVGQTGLYRGNMAEDGYIYMAVEGRGAPAPKGREWRKSIYRKIGIINIRDQAMACKKIIERFPFVDGSRIAVHGWSGGGSTTLNLLFQYPELYQTGIAVAAVANQLSYDNIYQERYMGLPQENLEDFIQGSPITHAKNLEGNLLYIHGTGDDNVHYQNAEMLLNELIKHNKQFQFMAYPNRSHGIYEGSGTRQHLGTLFTNFLREKCPPGGIKKDKTVRP
jgi:dipeptidyl-peptidase-4